MHSCFERAAIVQAQFDPVTLAYHELRAPLGLMLTAAQSAVEECEDLTIRRRCEVIARTAERMLRTAQEMLRQAASDREDEQLFLPAQIVSACADDLVELGVTVSVEISEEAVSARCHGAPSAFEALMQSLISNARDHAPAGASLDVALGREGSCLAVNISNEIAAADDHVGLGAGRWIEASLSSQLGAGLESGSSGGRFVARLTVPALFV
jgi:two-component system sensor histidine kinase QseC